MISEIVAVTFNDQTVNWSGLTRLLDLSRRVYHSIGKWRHANWQKLVRFDGRFESGPDELLFMSNCSPITCHTARADCRSRGSILAGAYPGSARCGTITATE